MIASLSHPLVSMAAAALLAVCTAYGTEQDTAALTISLADDVALEALTSTQLRAMDDGQVISFYASRMSSPGPGNQWVTLVDSDILGRSKSGELLLRLLKQPPHRSIRAGVWHWLSEHPNFAATPSLLSYSLELYRSGINNWRWEDRSAFASFLAASGPAEVWNIIDELAALGGPGVDFAKDRYRKRMKAIIDPRPVEVAPTPKPPSVAQSPTPKKATEVKPTSTPSEEPTSSTPWSIIVVLIVAAVGLLWLLLKRRS